ncbi:MAG: rhodanese-like domain-containing protein [Mycoplasmatota bacterium]|nr:rhodanese-like domain-containing protein [Mycoplasmatota bacterium]
MKRIIIILMLSCFLITGCSLKKLAVVEKIEVAKVKQIIDNSERYPNTIIIDVRTEEEYLLKHLKGAINIPLDEIKNIDIAKDKQIILYCQSGNRSSQAGEILVELGYKHIFDMGGTNSWIYEFSEGEEK